MNKSARIVFASRDQQVVERLREIVGPGGIEVLSLTDLALPEPSCPERHTARMAAYKATVIAALTDLPALGYARSFRTALCCDGVAAARSGLGRSLGRMPQKNSRSPYAQFRQIASRLTRGHAMGADAPSRRRAD